MDVAVNTLWSWFISLALTGLVLVSSECPKDVLKKAMLCTANLGIGPPTSGPPKFFEMGEVEKAKTACREGLFMNTISCLSRLTNKCRGNSEREHILRMMVDPEKSRHSVAYFCKNIHIYESHASCISDAHDEQVECAKDVQNNFKTKAMATVNMDVLITSTCRYYKAAVSCSSRVIKGKCGQAAAGIVVTMLQGFQPPRCLQIKFDDVDDGYTVDSDKDTPDEDPVSGSTSSMYSHTGLVTVVYAILTLLFVQK